MASSKDDYALDEEDEASDNLQVPRDGLGTMVSSPTTDTLDSVALEPPAFDDIGKLCEAENDEMDEVQNVKQAEGEENTKGGGETMGAPASNISSLTMEAPDSSNISSYFADSGENFFDSIGGAESADSKLGSDLFMSIAMSKSEEDIRASEMNAREIKESDIKSSLTSPNEEDEDGMRRTNSFLRKSEELESNPEKLYEVLEKSLAEASLDHDPSSEYTHKEGESKSSDLEENITHIHHRERTTSACEPETIAFEGELETTAAEPVDFELADMIGADIEEMGQTSGTPSFMSQVSHSSDHSTSDTKPHPQKQNSQQSLQVDRDHMLGLVVGTTPSQLSPAGTPIHQLAPATSSQMAEQHPAQEETILTTTTSDPAPSASAATAAAASSSTTAPPPVTTTTNSGRPVFDSQASMPGSPFHQPGSEVTAGPSIFGPFGNSAGPADDDAFTSILSMSDADRRHDAWIPSDATSHILKAMLTGGGQAVYAPAVEQLSTPGVISNEPQGDPVRDLVLRYMGEQEAIRRSVLTVDSVAQDVDGLKKLMEAGCLRAAIDLTGRLLDQVGQGHLKSGQVTVHTPHSLQLWSCRLALMVKLRMFDAAEAEILAFQSLDTPDLYFQFYPNTYPGRRGSMVSFSMRLLHAELPLLCGRSQETLDRLYYMLAVCNRIKSNLASELSEDGSSTHMTYEARKASTELWAKREVDIINKIGSTMLSVKDYEGALVIYNSLLEKDKKSHLEHLAGIGRIHLQMGNITEATRIMKEVEAESSKTDSSLSCHNLVNRGLVAMCGANFFDGYQHFKSAVQLQPQNTCAVNNMAVCSLYLGRLKDALNTLEQLVHSDPARTLHEGVLFNLCTLYELETSRALHKKQAILDLVSKHKGDGFPVACLKMA